MNTALLWVLISTTKKSHCIQLYIHLLAVEIFTKGFQRIIKV